jgi:hypothetical protein
LHFLGNFATVIGLRIGNVAHNYLNGGQPNIGLAYEEIAEVMGCPKGTVMSRLHHARKKLQVALRPFLEEAGEHDLADRAGDGVRRRE